MRNKLEVLAATLVQLEQIPRVDPPPDDTERKSPSIEREERKLSRG